MVVPVKGAHFAQIEVAPRIICLFVLDRSRKISVEDIFVFALNKRKRFGETLGEVHGEISVGASPTLLIEIEKERF